MYICIYVYMYICIYVYMYICIYVYISGLEIHELSYLSAGQVEVKVHLSMHQLTCPMNKLISKLISVLVMH